MRKALAIAVLSVVFVGATPLPSYADVTAFFGVGHRPDTRTVKGAAVGITLIALGFEVEYSDFSEKDTADAASPRLRTGMVNALVQTPTSGAQLYGTAGVGVFRENYRQAHQETNTAINIGGGLKMGLMGPVKLRIDYRLFKLRGDQVIERTVHRVYAGVNASF